MPAMLRREPSTARSRCPPLRDDVVAARTLTVYQRFAHAVVLLAILAVARKLISLELTTSDTLQLFALAAAIVALGAVHWLVRKQDRREGA
jgi:uncharacterized membrane protein (DUF373 family)